MRGLGRVRLRGLEGPSQPVGAVNVSRWDAKLEYIMTDGRTSVYVYPGRQPLEISATDANEPVTTTRRTVDPGLAAELRMEVVPAIAGCRTFSSTFSMEVMNGDAMCAMWVTP